MGIAIATSSKLGESIQIEPTFLEKVLGPLQTLDIPANVLRGGIAFARTGESEYLGRAFSPFKNRVSGGEALGFSEEESPWLNLGAEIGLDPSTYTGVGTATKTGKLLDRISDIKNTIAAANRLGKGEIAAKHIAELSKLKGQFRELNKMPRRSLVSLGLPFTDAKLHFSDTAKLAKLAAKVNPLPDTQLLTLLNKQAKLESQLAKTPGLEDTIAPKLAKVTAQAEGLHKGIVSPETAATIRKNARIFTALFNKPIKSELLERAREITKSEQAGLIDALGTKVAAETQEFENVRQALGLSEKAMNERLLYGQESRFVRESVFPDLQGLSEVEKHNLRLGTKKKIKSALKIKDPVKLQERLDELKDSLQRGYVDIDKRVTLRQQKLAEYVKFHGAMQPAEVKLMNILFDDFSGMVDEAKKFNIRIDPLTSSKGMLSYARRLWSPQALELKKSNPRKFSLITEAISSGIGAAKKRRTYLEDTIIDINQNLKQDFKIGFDFFEPDAIKVSTMRRKEHIESIHKAALNKFAVEQFAQTNIKGIPVKKFYKDVGMEYKDVPKNLKLPTDIHDQLKGVDSILNQTIFSKAKGMAHFLDTVNTYVNTPTRLALTTMFPKYHIRNKVGNIFNSILGKGFSLVEETKADILGLKKALKKLSPDEEKEWSKLTKYGIVNQQLPDELTEQLQRFPRLTEIAERPIRSLLNLKKVIRGEFAGIDPSSMDPLVGRAFGRFMENTSRIAFFRTKLKQGYTEFEAAKLTNKYLFDYSDLTGFEKQFMRPTFLFYTWLRKNIPLMISTTLREPKYAAIFNHITDLGPDDVPTYLRGGNVFPVPGNEGLFIGSLGLPIEDLNTLNVSDADPVFFDQVSRLADKIGSKLSPAFKIPIELMKGQTLFSRRPLRNLTTGELIKELTPASRFLRTAQDLTDPEKPLDFRILDFLTGVRTYPVTKTRAQIDTLKRKMLQTGKFDRSGFLVFPKEKSKAEQQVKQLQRQLARLNKQREKENAGK